MNMHITLYCMWFISLQGSCPSGVTLVYAHVILTRNTYAYELMSQAILSLSAQHATIKG